MRWHLPPLDEQRWHAEGPNDRTIVAENGESIGMMDTGTLALRVVQDHNAAVAQYTGYPQLSAA